MSSNTVKLSMSSKDGSAVHINAKRAIIYLDGIKYCWTRVKFVAQRILVHSVRRKLIYGNQDTSVDKKYWNMSSKTREFRFSFVLKSVCLLAKNTTGVIIIGESSTHSISIDVNFMNGDEVIETWVDDKLYMRSCFPHVKFFWLQRTFHKFQFWNIPYWTYTL